MYQGPIIDPHMHLWNLGNPGYEWLTRPEPVFGNGANHRNFLVNDYLSTIKNQNIVAAVHVECYGFPDDPVLETAWVQQQADKHGWPHAITAKINLDADDVELQMERHCQHPLMRATRTNLNNASGCISFCERTDMMQDKAWLHGYGLLSKYNLMYEMQCYDTQFDQVYCLAKHYPDTTMIINHLGWPSDLSQDGFKQWRQRLSQLAELPYIHLKLSGPGIIFMKNDPSWITPYIETGIELFGIDRCMFASNCPPDMVYIPLDDLYTLFKKAVNTYSTEEQSKLFYNNAKQVYRIII